MIDISESKIYCILGKSGSGKDTIFKELLKKTDLKPVVTYTTRPIRSNEKTGVDYHFINDEQLRRLDESGKIIEVRYYNTVHGVWAYATIDDGQIDLRSQDKYLIITTPEAYKKIRDYFGEDKVVPIYIVVEDGVRLERALKREREQEKPGFAEMCRRFLADCEDFHSDRLEAMGIKRYYENKELSECLREIIDGERL